MFPRICFYIDNNSDIIKTDILSKKEYDLIFDPGKMSDSYEEYINKQNNITSKNNTNVSITKEEIYNFYINLEYSISDLSKHYIISVTDCAFILDYFNIPRRNLKAANSTKKRSKDFKETCLKKYGVDHYNKTNEFKEKIISTCLSKYGVANVLQNNILKAKYWLILTLPMHFG